MSSGEALAAALEYAAAWRGRTVIVKVGGSLVEGPGIGTVARDLVLLGQAGVRAVLVHGGGPAISRLSERLGHEPRFVDGLRVSDAATVDAAEMVLSGTLNKRLVGWIAAHGGRAAGISGRDGGMVRVRPHAEAGRLGRVGEVERIDPALLEALLSAGFLPVVSPVAAGPGGVPYNVNADTLAAALAGALGAEKLLVVTDVQGVLVDRGDGPNLCAELGPGELLRLVAEGIVSRGMVPKAKACIAALSAGVRSAHILDGRQPHGLLLELFTREGIGTMVRADAEPGRGGADSARGAA